MAHVSSVNPNNLAPILTGFGEMLTGKNIPHVAWRFDYGINSRIVTSTTANGGTVTNSASKAVLSSSVAVNGSASIQTVRTLRYMPGVAGHIRFTAVFSTPKADSMQIIGIGNTADGFFIGYNGLQFGVLRRRDSQDFWTYEADFNGDEIDFDKTKGNIYSITYQWLGYGFIQFSVVNPRALRENQFIPFNLLHAIEYPNTSAEVHIINPTLPLYAQVVNTGNDSDVVLQTPSAVAFLQGGIEADYHPLDVSNAFDVALTLANTDNNHALTLRNDTTIGAITNRVPIEIRSITFTRGSAGATLSRFRLYRNATTAIPLVYVDFNATDSSAQTSVTTTTITSVNAESAYAVSSVDTILQLKFERGELVLQPDEALSLAIQNAGVQSTECVVTINWNEQF